MLDEGETLWDAGLNVAHKLRDHGYEAYLVGGCVRDRLLGRALHDIDITSSAHPEQVAQVFERTLPTGIRHGTVTVLLDGRAFEVTTYRTESGYSDARRPDAVSFVSDIREDLARRDFTINAMAAGVSGEWIDPFGGKRDLAVGRIRCVGEAGLRFGEDALRMLRAIRFAAEFGFALTLSVWRGIRSQAPRLRHVAMERVGAEWEKMMAGSDPDRACALLLRSGLPAHLKDSLPDVVVTDEPPCSAEEETTRLRDLPDTELRWIAFLLRLGASPDDGAQLCRVLRFSGKRASRIVAAVTFDHRMKADGVERSSMIRGVLELGRRAAEDWLQTRITAGTCRQWLDELAIESPAQLAIRGDELARHLGKAPGPWVSRTLKRLTEEAAFGRLVNERQTLLQAAEAYDNR